MSNLKLEFGDGQTVYQKWRRIGSMLVDLVGFFGLKVSENTLENFKGPLGDIQLQAGSLHCLCKGSCDPWD